MTVNIKYFMENMDYDLVRGTPGASGYDLRANIGSERFIEPGQRWLVSTGLYLEMPKGIEAQIRSRSGLAINHGVIVLNAPGTVDSDYRGEVKVTLQNHGDRPYHMIPGERIAQLVFAPVVVFDDQNYLHTGYVSALQRVLTREDLSDTQRGSGGHGSTGR